MVWDLAGRRGAGSHLLPAIWSELDAVVGHGLVNITVFYLRQAAVRFELCRGGVKVSDSLLPSD